MPLVTKTQGDISLIALGTGTPASPNGDILLNVGTTGAVTITGDLTVYGNTELTVSPIFTSPTITLNDILTPTDVNADGGGVILRGTTDKELLWYDATNAWSSNQNFDLTNSNSTYQIAGATVISATALGEGITVDGGTY